jgi:spore coat protein CotH
MKKQPKISQSSFFFLPVMFCLLLSCTKESIPSVTPTPVVYPKIFVVPKYVSKGTEKYLSKNSDYVYDQEMIKTYHLILKNEDLRKLNADPAKEEYIEGALVFEGDTISPVGIRYKGTIGAFAGCLSGPDFGNPSGFKTCEKLSMQIKINWGDRKERFYDLNKLQFHAQNYDKSQLRERLGYWLFNQMGVPAPRAVHARLMISEQYSGLYGLIEEIDNRFVDYFYKTGKGNVFKEVWPVKVNGIAQDDKIFRAALKTNEGDNTDISLMKEFAKAVETSTPTNSKDVIAKYMDVKSIMSYIVVDRGIRHDDGPFHWYCLNGIPCNNHNYYWFEDQKNAKVHIIPWDIDGAFEQIYRGNNSITVITDKWGKSSNNCEPFFYPNSPVKQLSASCDKLTASWLKFNDEYLDLKKTFQKSLLSDEKAIKQLETWAKQISPFIKEADDKFNTGITNPANKKATTLVNWQNAVTDLKSQVEITRNASDF